MRVQGEEEEREEEREELLGAARHGGLFRRFDRSVEVVFVAWGDVYVCIYIYRVGRTGYTKGEGEGRYNGQRN